MFFLPFFTISFPLRASSLLAPYPSPQFLLTDLSFPMTYSFFNHALQGFQLTFPYSRPGVCRVSDACRTQGRMARRVNILLYVVKLAGFVAFPTNSNPVCFRMETNLLPSVNPHFLLDRSVSERKRSFFDASKLLINDPHRIYLFRSTLVLLI